MEKVPEITSMIESMEAMIEEGILKEQLKDIIPNTQIQVQMTKAMIDRKVMQVRTGK